MTPREIAFLILIVLAAHFIYWNLVLFLVLRRYKIPTITNPTVDIHSSPNGDDIVIGRAKYSRIKKGDVVFRPLHFLGEKKLHKTYFMRFLSMGMPGTAEHASAAVSL